MSEHPSLSSEFEVSQSEFFDGWADRFANAQEDAAVTARLQRVSDLAALNADDVVLDVGTGCGVMVPLFRHLGVPPEQIVGIDLSEGMLEVARQRYPDVRFAHGSFYDLTPNHQIFRLAGSPTAIVFNACFANLPDPRLAVATAATLLSPKGRVIISHPLGRRFVEMLHQREPHIVPNLLPDRSQLLDLFASSGLRLTTYLDEDDFYCVLAEKA